MPVRGPRPDEEDDLAATVASLESGVCLRGSLPRQDLIDDRTQPTGRE
jgi:hypothetical protein